MHHACLPSDDSLPYHVQYDMRLLLTSFVHYHVMCLGTAPCAPAHSCTRSYLLCLDFYIWPKRYAFLLQPWKLLVALRAVVLPARHDTRLLLISFFADSQESAKGSIPLGPISTRPRRGPRAQGGALVPQGAHTQGGMGAQRST